MEFNKSDLFHFENIIRILKRQKYDKLTLDEVKAFGAAVIWLDQFHTKAEDHLKTIPVSNVAVSSTPKLHVKKSKKRKGKK